MNDKRPFRGVCVVWWTRRELNPRPKAVNGQDYMLSSQFDLAVDTSMSTLAANQPT